MTRGIAVVVVACVAWAIGACASAPEGELLTPKSAPEAGASPSPGAAASPTPSPSGAAATDDAGGGTSWSDSGTVAPVDAATTPGCAGATVCEDFEEYANGLPDAGPVWSVSAPDCSGTGALSIDDTEAHSGTRSLKVAGTAGYCNHIFLATSAPAALTGAVWARFYVRLTTALDADHATFLAMHDSDANTDLRMGGQDGVFMWNRESDDATLPEMSPQGTALSVAPSVAAWHCVELTVDPQGPGLQTWVDGAAVAGLLVGPGASSDADGQWITDTAWAPRLVDARFGWESYAGESETLWFDDIALGPSRIGCE